MHGTTPSFQSALEAHAGIQTLAANLFDPSQESFPYPGASCSKSVAIAFSCKGEEARCMCTHHVFGVFQARKAQERAVCTPRRPDLLAKDLFDPLRSLSCLLAPVLGC